MGFWTYFAPLWLGTLIVAVYQFTAIPFVAKPEDLGLINIFMVTIPLRSLIAGLGFQSTMIGFQGIFAKVLPVPVGRSIRGGVAQVVGGLILGFGPILCFAVGFSREDSPSRLTYVFLAIAGVCLITALLVYLMNLPNAVKDF